MPRPRRSRRYPRTTTRSPNTLVWRIVFVSRNHIFSRPLTVRPAGEPFGTPLRTVKREPGATTGVLLPAASSTATPMVWTPSVSFVVSIVEVRPTWESGHGVAPANSYGLELLGLTSA